MAEDIPQNSPGKGREFRWDKRKTEAARLVAEGELTEQEIADKVDADRKTIYHWKQQPEFAARVAELIKEFGEIATRYAIGRCERRVRYLDDRHKRLMQVIKDRAADPKMQEVPGGLTGMLTRDVKACNGETVELYAVDTGLLRELREHEKQAAQELGQWMDRHEVSGEGGKPILVTVVEAVKPPSVNGNSTSGVS